MTSAIPSGGKARRTYQNLAVATCAEIEASGSFTAERVALRAGSSPATFYAYFSSKDDALTAAFQVVLDRLVEFVEEAMTVESLLELGLESFCERFAVDTLTFFRRESQVFRLALARLAENAPLRTAYRTNQRLALARYQRWIELGQAAGKLRMQEPEMLARVLMVLTQGFNNPIALATPRDEVLEAELGRSLFVLLCPEPTKPTPAA
jgi:AcrR family transcriptional regulator